MKPFLIVFFTLLQHLVFSQTEHEVWTNILQKNVNEEGNVNYKSLKEHSSELITYLKELEKNQPQDSWDTNRQKAYWINAYNAYTIQLVLNNYPIKSIKDIKNPWDQDLIPFNGTLISLNTLEHKILRKMNDPKIHFAIVCASISCPRLQTKAFEPETLELQLNRATKEFLSDATKNSFSTNLLELSKIFRWFRKDFELDGSLIDFLNNYSDIKIDEKAKIKFKDYNWDLNE